eukprot:SAG31_NODE_3340_length_4380_cov_23.463119_3_plen_94_part_00
MSKRQRVADLKVEGDVSVSECIRVGTRSPVPQLHNRVSLTLLNDPLSLLLPTCTSVHPSVDQPEQTGVQSSSETCCTVLLLWHKVNIIGLFTT